MDRPPRRVGRRHHPGRLVRQPGEGAADGGHRRAVPPRSRPPARPPGVVSLGPGAEREGPGARPGLRRRQLLHGRLGQRDPQPEEHRHEHRRGHRPHHRDGPAGGRGRQAASRCRCSRRSAAASKGPCRRSACSASSRRFLDAGLTTISLADTAGHADPAQVEALFGAVRGARSGWSMTCHFHDTYGLGLANVYAAWRAGVTSFESAFGGLGGCPFTAVAAGNVCTEDLVHMLQRMGRATRRRPRAPSPASRRTPPRSSAASCPASIHQTGPIPHPGRPECTQRGADRMKLLDGIRVLDLTNVLAGPVRHAAPGAAGRRGHQDREPRGRRPGAQARQRARRSTRS